MALQGKNRKGETLPMHSTDQGVRPNISVEQMSKMKTLSDNDSLLFVGVTMWCAEKGGVITAALASQVFSA